MSYAGDISCRDCWEALKSDATAQLVDVRTHAEWSLVGFPVLEELGKSAIMVEWQQYPAMDINTGFIAAVSDAIKSSGVSQDAHIFTLCRSGVRSIAAAEALTSAGFGKVYNVRGGFEGNMNAEGHRSTVSGWKHDQLPWRQN
ncbi:MAG: rhodanese-like domain-containing protein [Pseudomonadota bacterium]